ncbi:unnamed protein product [Calypogeia fissa]
MAGVSAQVMKCAAEAQTRASEGLLQNLRLMLNEPSFSDVVFLCNDGKRVHASRMLLAGRSEVLKSMCMNGMQESSQSEIKMPAISSPVLLAVFEYLYTGTLMTYEPQSWRIICELLIASRFFLLSNLEMITRKLMHLQTSAVTDDLQKAACMLTEAVSLKPPCHEIDEPLTDLVTILSSNWYDSEYVKSLSEDAFDYLLKDRRGSYVADDRPSFEEYLRFRQVIRWWIYQIDYGSCAAEELLAFIAPDENGALSLCINSDDFKGVENPPEDAKGLAQDWNRLQAQEASRKSALRLVSNIDCLQIHPALLVKVVEPLKVISAQETLDSFRFHALRRPMTFKILQCSWDYTSWDSEGEEIICTLERGSVIKKTQNKVESAVITTPMSRTYGEHQWHFILGTYDNVFAEMGFIYATEKPELDGQRLSDQHCYDAMVLKLHGDEVSVNKRRSSGRVNWRVLCSKETGITAENATNMRVSFHYNAFEHNCSLSINHRDFGVVWKNLPIKSFYPAVSLGTYSTGSGTIRFVCGSNIS